MRTSAVAETLAIGCQPLARAGSAETGAGDIARRAAKTTIMPKIDGYGGKG